MRAKRVPPRLWGVQGGDGSSVGARALLVVLLAGVVLPGCRESEEAPPPALRPVAYLKAAPSEEGRIRTFSGVAQAGIDAPLSFKVGGTIDRLEVKVGDRVRPGQLIAELNPLDYQLQVEDAQASLHRAQAEARNAEANFARTRDLYESGNASRNEYDAARAASESTRASVNSVEKRLELARRQLDYTRLVAPLAGDIAEVNVEVSQNVGAGQQIVRLTSSSSLEVVVGVPESLIPRIHRGSSVLVTFDALPSGEFAAVVTEAGVAATGAGSTFPVTVRLSRPDPDLRAGMTAEVAFSFGRADHEPRFYLPPHTVLEDREGRFVFLAEPAGESQGVIRRQAVTVGELSAEGLEVLSGLQEGDRVVTAGLSFLAEGDKVRLDAGK